MEIRRLILPAIGLAAVAGGQHAPKQSGDLAKAAEEVESAAKAYRAAGLPWEARDLRAPVKPEQNAWPLLEKAGFRAGALPRFDDPKIARLLNRNAPNDAATKFQQPAASLTLAEQASRLPFLDSGTDLDLSAINVDFATYAQMKVIVKALCRRAEVKAQGKMPESATRDLATAERLSVLLGQQPGLIPMLVEVACQAVVLDSIQWCAGARVDSPKGLRTLQGALPGPRDLPGLYRPLLGESYTGLALIRNMKAMDEHRKDMMNMILPGGRKSLDTSWVIRTGIPKDTESRAYFARHLQFWTQAKPLMDKFKNNPDRLQAVMNWLAKKWEAKKNLASYKFITMTDTALESAGTPITRLRANMLTTRALLAAMLIRNKTGHWPSRITDIPGRWPDPFTGKPLKLKLMGGGIRIYSVGPNGRDDGGIFKSEIKDETKQDQYDDVIASYPPRPLSR